MLPLVSILTFFIMQIWALGEALLDVRCLLEGGCIPFIKAGSDWRLDLDGLLEIGKQKSLAVRCVSETDAVYMPVKDDLVSMAKLEEFEEYLGEADQTDVKGRIQRLKLPENSTVLRGENYMEQLLWGELGDYVRRLLNGGRPKQL